MNTMSENYTCLKIERLEVNLRLGVRDKEQNGPQRVFIDVELFTPPDYLQTADELSMVDYEAICEEIKKLERRPQVKLVETLARDVLNIAFSYRDVVAAKVKILKPDVISYTEGVGIEVFSQRSSEAENILKKPKALTIKATKAL